MTAKIGLLILAGLIACCAGQRNPCACARNYRPVCGSDGKTYSNECTLNCARYEGNSDLEIVRKGECEEKKQQQHSGSGCICNQVYKPVCGEDGSTYANECEAYCRNVKIIGDDECTKIIKVEPPPCICTREKRPVCGTDGVTYSNPCLLNCANRNNSRLGIAYYGACENGARYAKKPANHQPSCVCTRIWMPVCGANGVTYGNECQMECAGVSKLKDGRCEDVSVAYN